MNNLNIYLSIESLCDGWMNGACVEGSLVHSLWKAVCCFHSLFEAMTSLTLLFFLFFSFQGRWMDGSLKLFQDIVSFLMFLCPLRLVRSESIVVCFHSGRLPF